MSFPKLLDRPWGPTSLLLRDYRRIVLGGKAAGCKADHLPMSGAEVKNEYTSIPPLCLHGVHVDNVTFFTFIG